MTAPSQSLDRSDVVRLARTLAALPTAYRLALELRHLEGWSLAAIANALKLDEPSVAYLLRHGLRLLTQPDGPTLDLTDTAPEPEPVDAALAAHLDTDPAADRTEFLARHPELADFFRAADRLSDLAAPLQEVWASRLTATGEETLDAQPPLVEDRPLPVIPGYEILGELGGGGMGIVYLARELSLRRLVALKVIRAGELATQVDRVRFQAEAEAAARLQHPHIVQVFHIGAYQGQPYCEMEYVPGGTLRTRLANTPQPIRWAAELVRTLALAVQVAHAAHIVHRDLKPANILLTLDGVPKVADFGLAKVLGDERDLTRPDAIVGTPAYMAPEQAAGLQDVGPTADVYALGVILYECLTGRPPFQEVSPLKTLERVRRDDPKSVRSQRREVPRDLETICLKCLEKQPNQRYCSARELADRLALFLAGEPIPDRPRSWLNKASRWLWRHPLLTGAALLCLAAVTTLLVVRHYSDPERPRYLMQAALARGEAYTFQGTEPLPGPFRQVGGAAMLLSPNKGDLANFTVDTLKAAFWELTPDPPCESYEFSVEVQHESQTGASEAGLYFGHYAAPAQSPRRGTCYTFTIADRGALAVQQPNGLAQCRVALQTWLWEDSPNLLVSRGIVGKRQSEQLSPLIPPFPWRKLILVVTPETVTASWQTVLGDSEQVASLAPARLSQRLHDSTVSDKRFREMPTTFQPRSGLGLFVSRARASFRNVSLRPLPNAK